MSSGSERVGEVVGGDMSRGRAGDMVHPSDERGLVFLFQAGARGGGELVVWDWAS